MTTIKCKKCGTDLEIPYDSKQCKICGKDLISSLTHAIKTAEAATKKMVSNIEEVTKLAIELHKASVKKVTRINNSAEKEIKKIAEDCISEIKACSSTRTKAELEAIAEKSRKAQQAVLDKAVRNTNMIVENHKKEIEWLSEETGFELTQALLDKMNAAMSVKPIKPKSVKFMDLTNTIGYLLFFLITPLGMVTAEEYFLGGAIVIAGGFMALPPVQNKILKSFDWISLVSLWLLTLVVIVTGVLKVILSMGAGV